MQRDRGAAGRFTGQIPVDAEKKARGDEDW
jgi:hypothetical protein